MTFFDLIGGIFICLFLLFIVLMFMQATTVSEPEPEPDITKLLREQAKQSLTVNSAKFARDSGLLAVSTPLLVTRGVKRITT